MMSFLFHLYTWSLFFAAWSALYHAMQLERKLQTYPSFFHLGLQNDEHVCNRLVYFLSGQWTRDQPVCKEQRHRQTRRSAIYSEHRRIYMSDSTRGQRHRHHIHCLQLTGRDALFPATYRRADLGSTRLSRGHPGRLNERPTENWTPSGVQRNEAVDRAEIYRF